MAMVDEDEWREERSERNDVMMSFSTFR